MPSMEVCFYFFLLNLISFISFSYRTDYDLQHNTEKEW